MVSGGETAKSLLGNPKTFVLPRPQIIPLHDGKVARYLVPTTNLFYIISESCAVIIIIIIMIIYCTPTERLPK